MGLYEILIDTKFAESACAFDGENESCRTNDQERMGQPRNAFFQGYTRKMHSDIDWERFWYEWTHFQVKLSKLSIKTRFEAVGIRDAASGWLGE